MSNKFFDKFQNGIKREVESISGETDEYGFEIGIKIILMTPKEITQIIEKEIDGDWSITNSHNCDLKTCLIRPKKRNLRFGDQLKEVWIVLEENPQTLEESKIYFDDETQKFGLAMYSEAFSYVCNSHDTFLAAFKSM